MTTYKFCVASTGTLMCYKTGNGFRKYNGKAALKLLEHIKNFSFYHCNTLTYNTGSKYTYDMQFVSDNHKVTFQDVYKFKKKNEVSIEDEIGLLIDIVKNNKAEIRKKKKNSIIKKITTATSTISLAAIMLLTAKTSVDKNIKYDKVLDNKTVKECNSETKGITYTKANIKSAYEKEIEDIATKSIEEVENDSKNNLSPAERKELFNKPIVPGEELILEDKEETVNIEEYVQNYYDDNLNATNISTSEIETEAEEALSNIIEENTQSHEGQVLTAKNGTVNGPSGGKETYYALNMSKVVSNMREQGFDEENYPYWVREDGVKMIGDYVMVAANLDVHPRGSLVPTTLGVGIVCDTGDFAKTNKLQLDIATNWK